MRLFLACAVACLLCAVPVDAAQVNIGASATVAAESAPPENSEATETETDMETEADAEKPAEALSEDAAEDAQAETPAEDQPLPPDGLQDETLQYGCGDMYCDYIIP